MSFKLKQEIRREDPRVTRTRQLLVQAFMGLMKEKNFQSITIRDIAERATVNRVTFYAHFADKYALFEHTIRDMFRQRLRSQLPEDAPFTPENLALLVQVVCEFLGEMERVCPPPHGQMEQLMEKQVKNEIREILVDWLGEKSAGDSSIEQRRRDLVHQHPDPEQAAMVASWAIYGAAAQWIQQKRRESAEDYVQEVLPLILGSLQAVVE